MKKKSDELSFTWENLQKELDQYRGAMTWKNLTDEQLDFLRKCRNHQRPVSYTKMAVWWEQLGWGKITGSTLQNFYERIKGDA